MGLIRSELMNLSDYTVQLAKLIDGGPRRTSPRCSPSRSQCWESNVSLTITCIISPFEFVEFLLTFFFVNIVWLCTSIYILNVYDLFFS